jgi:hypothetical protein
MQILDLSESSDGSPFCIRRIMMDGEKYYAEIQPLQSRFKIMITKADYRKILDASQLSKIIKIYPFEGKISRDNEFTGGEYKLEIV